VNRAIVFGHVLGLALALAGCARLPAAAVASECEAERVVHVVSHGWHTGVVLEREALATLLPAIGGDLGDRHYVEIGWGDGKYYPAEKGTVGLALRALLWPTPSVLQVVPFTASPREYFAQSDVAAVPVDEAGYRAVLEFVARSFERTREGGVVRLGRSQYGEGWFYSAEGSFHAFNTCNTWVARAIGKAGYPVSSRTVTARGLFSQLPRAGCERP
jgi:uncharacterized protein (TIGR02117 family)